MIKGELNRFAVYNIGWDKGWQDPYAFYGVPSFGKDYYGNHRAIAFKFTTPTLTPYTNYKLVIKMPICRSSSAGSGTDVWHYKVTTSLDGTVGTGGGSTSFTMPDEKVILFQDKDNKGIKIYAPSQNSGYLLQTFELAEYSGYKSNTSYYILLYSDTPYYQYSNYYMGFISNNASFGGTISINFEKTSPVIPPEDLRFKWDVPKTDDSWIITAAEWNRFCEKFTEKTGITVFKGYQTGQYFTTEQFNEIARILKLNYRIFEGNQFMGHYFNDLSDALDKLPEPEEKEEETVTE